MCGIAGIYAYHYAAPAVDRKELRAIREQMRRRGPDGAGDWFSDDGRLGLAHRRLKIIDLSDDAAQPMVSSCGRYRISYNGEIYNYRELRTQLEARGHAFATQSDTEVLLAMFAEYGEAMFAKLRGMYAFGLWDRRERKLLLARDSFGIKPLYYADDGWTCRFASQVKALRAGGRISDDPEPAGQAGFLLFGSVPEPFTLWQEIRALPAGHYLWVDEMGAGAARAHFELPSLFAAAAPTADVAQGLRAALLDSVRQHLVADVPVGAFLSSGIDSTVLLSLMREVASGPVRTVTIGFEEFRGSPLDECPLAAKAAARYGAEHHQKMVSRAEFERDLPDIMAAMDQPSIDGINTWMVSKACAEAGLKVAISGLGGDELSGGYPAFRDVPRWHRALAWSGWIPGLGAATRWLLDPWLPLLGVHPKAAGMLEYGSTRAGCYLLKRGLFMPWELPGLLGREAAHAGLKRLDPLVAIEATGSENLRGDFSAVSAMELGFYMKNQLLRDTDWAAMAHSIEVRVPLVDVPLLTACNRLFPAGVGKQDLAGSASPGLPQPLLSAKQDRFFNAYFPMAASHTGRAQGRTLVPPLGASIGGAMRVLALMAEAYGSLGGIQEFNRHWIGALAGDPRVESIRVLVLGASDIPPTPAKVAQQRPRFGKFGYALAAVRAARWLRPGDLLLCGHLNLAPVAYVAGFFTSARKWLQLHGIEAWSPTSKLRTRAVQGFDLITAVSRYTRRRFLAWAHVAADTVKVLPNTVGGEFRPGPVPDDFRARLGIDGKRVLLTVGRLSAGEAYKGHDLIIGALPELLKTHPDLVYLVVGDGDDRARLEAMASERGLADRVRFLGRLSGPDLIDLYRSAELFVMPSGGEGFGIVFLEAMACGCPVLGFGADGSVDPLRDGEAGTVSSAAGLLGDLQDHLARRDRSYQPQQASTPFTLDSYAGQIRMLLESVLHV